MLFPELRRVTAIGCFNPPDLKHLRAAASLTYLEDFMNRKTALITAAGALGGLGAFLALRKTDEADLAGKVVLITGGSRGLGLQLAREFASQGCAVAICARDERELERARLDIARPGVRTGIFQCDVTDREAVEKMIRDVTAEFGRIDILVNNAGVIQVGPIEAMNAQDFEETMNVIFWGTVYPTLAVLPQMRQRREGRIVNITSIGGKVSIPHLVPYSCAKFAAVAFSEGLRAEMAARGIHVTTVVPGLMRTGSHVNAEFKGRQAQEYAWFSLGAATPLISMSAERAARSIVKATRRGDAEAILSVPAQVLAKLHGALPEVTMPVLEWVSRVVLPSSEAGASGKIKGFEAEREVNSWIHRGITSMGRWAARELNEVTS